jgi:hypothetical protein
MDKRAIQGNRTQRIAAILASGLVLASGAVATSMAAWSDTEWVVGGVGTAPGISTSIFQVQQNTTAADEGAWVDEPDSPGGVIAFVDASGLTPGDTAYGFVRLRTVEDSLAGVVTMQPAAHTGPDALYDALEYGAGLVATPAECAAGQFGAGDDTLVAFGAALDAAVAPTFSIAEDAQSEMIVCFAVTLPAGAPASLQGLTTLPEWVFQSESV